MPIHFFKNLGQTLGYSPEVNTLFVADSIAGDAATLTTSLSNRSPSKCTFAKSAGIPVVPTKADLAKTRFVNLSLTVTHRCNLSCDYCYFTKEHVAPSPIQDMTWKVAKKAIDLFRKQSAQTTRWKISFFGGEPFIKTSLITRIMEYTKKVSSETKNHDFYFSATTNGSLLNEAKIQYLSCYPLKLELSLDGSASCHNKHRVMKNGNRSHHTIERTAHLLLRYFRELNIRATWLPDGQTVSSRIKYFKALGATRVTISPLALVKDKNKWGKLSRKDYDQLLNEFSLYAHILIGKYQKGECPLYDPFSQVITSYILKFPFAACRSPAIYQISIDPDGTIYPCPRFSGMPHYSIGNVFDGFHFGAWQDFFRDYKCVLSCCTNCWAWSLCGGGCIADHAAFTGFTQPDTDLCYFRRRLTEISLGFFATLLNEGLDVVSFYKHNL